MGYYNPIKIFKTLITVITYFDEMRGIIRCCCCRSCRDRVLLSEQEEVLLYETWYQSAVRRELMMETMIGRVIHYYPKISVAAVVLEGHIAQGDRIHIHGPHDDLHQAVTSMEIEHIPIREADKGQDIGIKVIDRVHTGDIVYRES